MKAGRELDWLVAQKVLGWTRPPLDSPALIERYGGADTWYPSWGAIAPDVQGLSVIPHYSTDIADAWLVVEHFRSIKMDSDENYQRVAPFVFEIDKVSFWRLTASEAAHAICLASLRAVGVEVPG